VALRTIGGLPEPESGIAGVIAAAGVTLGTVLPPPSPPPASYAAEVSPRESTN